MATLTVGTGEQYSTIAAAVGAAQDGDTVLVNAGTYVNDFFTTYHKITLQSVGGLAIIDAEASPTNGKGIITSETDLTVNGFGFTGAAVGDLNGAGIRYEGGNLTVQNSVFWNNQDGILATPLVLGTGTVVITGSEFSHNGAGDGYSHNIYIGEVASLLVNGSYFHDASAGHELKSRALATTIENSRIQDNSTGTASYDVDLPDGGVDVLDNDVIEKGPDASNDYSIHTGGDGTQYAATSLVVESSTLINDNPAGLLLLNQTGATDTFSGDRVYGYAAGSLNTGPASFVGDTTLAAEPALNTASMVPQSTSPAPPPDASVGTTLPYWGPGGAVAASGRVLTVGARGEYASLQAALGQATDGDTIEVAAGVYTDQAVTITHRVIIEGVGGMAIFVEDASQPAAKGVFDAEADCTIENVDISGAHNPGSIEAGVYVGAGDVTVVNASIHGNDTGLSSGVNAAANLAVFGSDIEDNGNAAASRHNVEVFQINSLTVRNSTLAGAFSGHELYTQAFNNDIENDRVVDGATAGASYSLDFGLGGDDIVKNDLLVKGPDSQNSVLVNVGGEGTPYDNTSVQITGNTLVSQVQNPSHPYTYFIADNGGASLTPDVVAAGNRFSGGVPGSAWLSNVTDGGGNAAAGAVAASPASSVSLAAIPAAFSHAFAASTLSVVVSQGAATMADAAFAVAVDGSVVGTGLVTAGAGATQTVAFTANLSAGAHQVSLTALNPQSSDPLYLQTVTLDGGSYAAAAGATISSAGFTTTLNATGAFPLFDPGYYLAHNPDVAAAGLDPLQHFLTVGWKEGRDPSAYFDTSYYLKQNPDVAAAGMDPLLHFEEFGWKEGRAPSLVFSDPQYLAANPDVAAAGMDPLLHYMLFGQAEGRAAFVPGGAGATDPLVNAAYYDAQLGATLVPGGAAGAAQAAAGYAASGWQQGLNPDAFFNTSYYLAHNPDVAAAHIDPLLHYEMFGWKEGRDPSASFDTNSYLAANPDVKAAGMDPLLHYVVFGQAEGRAIYAAPA